MAGMAGVAAAAQSRNASGPKLRSTPAVCLYSQVLIKVPYDELGPVLKAIGVDGCDLSVQPGGHVDPANYSVDMMRAVEAITGVGLDVPVITTACTNVSDLNIRNSVAISAEMGVPLFRSGLWKYTAGEPEARLGEVQRDLSGLAALARAVKMTVVVENVAGDYVGAGFWDLHMVVRGMDPNTVGYDFDVGCATGAGGWEIPLRAARPRLKMVTVRDFAWTRQSGAWKAVPCPLGDGMVDFAAFFAALARVRFLGPISVQMEYKPKDEVGAVQRDVEFVRKHVNAAYGSA